jgi:hypothetical protein
VTASTSTHYSMRSLRPPTRRFSLILALSSLLLFASTSVIAADPPGWFPLIVRGGKGVTATYENGTLTVRFSKTQIAAAGPTKYGRMPLGSAAWVDRPLNDAEPFGSKQWVNQEAQEPSLRCCTTSFIIGSPIGTRTSRAGLSLRHMTYVKTTATLLRSAPL